MSSFTFLIIIAQSLSFGKRLVKKPFSGYSVSSEIGKGPNMIYVTADLHGISLNSFQALLKRSGFSSNDFLFILGDVIDRGEFGAELLLWLTAQPNMQLILGNHEAMLLCCSFLFEEVSNDSLDRLTVEQLQLFQNWLQNGGGPTLSGLKKLLKTDSSLLYGILDYLQDSPLYETISAGGRDFILVHSGLGGFHPQKPLTAYSPEELLWARPSLATLYYPNSLVVFGHTPTEYYGPAYKGAAIKTDTWICIDTGAALGMSPMVLRLDDLKEFY